MILQQKIFSFPAIRRMAAKLDVLNLWIQRHHQRRQLAQLDQRLLKDIGLDVDKAKAEANKPFWK